jgi:hypothetical protein
MKTYYFIAVVLLLIALTFLSEAQVPRTLSYQGVLSDTSGAPKPDGSYTLTFRLYATSTGVSALWTETKTLNAKQGIFNTILADQTPFGDSVNFDRPYWLSIQVGTESELSPRIPLTSVAYSLNATNSPGFSNFMVFNTSGTFTVRGGVSKMMVEMWGGGGGGGGGASDSNGRDLGSGGGGGGGGYGKFIFSVTPGTKATITVGLGGGEGSPCAQPKKLYNPLFPNYYNPCTTGGSGGNGGTTSFVVGGSNMFANGGQGGSGGCENCLGRGGQGGDSNALIMVRGGDGGWSKNGGFGGGTGGGGCSTNAMEAREPGGGGSCDFAGANGRVIVWW